MRCVCRHREAHCFLQAPGRTHVTKPSGVPRSAALHLRAAISLTCRTCRRSLAAQRFLASHGSTLCNDPGPPLCDHAGARLTRSSGTTRDTSPVSQALAQCTQQLTYLPLQSRAGLELSAFAGTACRCEGIRYACLELRSQRTSVICRHPDQFGSTCAS
jgi:hypothetical protein